MEIITVKNRLIFITEKWCDGDPSKGLTNNFHNLFGSLERSELDVEYENYFVDEQDVKGRTQEIIDKGPRAVVFSFLGNSSLNPDSQMIRRIHNAKIKTCVMWPDTGYPWALNKIKELGDSVDLHVSYGGERTTDVDNHLWLWAPQDEALFHPDVHRSEISFVGSLRGYHDRSYYLKYAIDAGVLKAGDIGGGQREEALTAEKYAERIRTSGMNINFPESPSGKDQCKGRVMEIIASESLLLERKNDATSRYLVPGKEYVEFDSLDDFVNKIKYYTSNGEECRKIASAGYEAYKNKYSSRIFWETVLNEL